MKIVYRVIAAVAALLAFPALWFMKLLHITIELGFTQGFLDDSFSLNDIYKFFEGKNFDPENAFNFSENVAEVLAPLKTPAIVTLVFLALTLVMVLAVFFCSALTNARKTNIVLSLTGAASVIGLMASFSHLTSLIIDGTVGIDKILNAVFADAGNLLGTLASLLGLGSAAGAIGTLRVFQLTSATVGVLFIFIFIALWSAAFVLIDMDEVKVPKAKKQKKQK